MLRHPNLDASTEPFQVALRKISEARRILEAIVTSSETFDYVQAKEGLKQLQRMIRELGREEARLRASASQIAGRGCAEVLPFPIKPPVENQPTGKD